MDQFLALMAYWKLIRFQRASQSWFIHWFQERQVLLQEMTLDNLTCLNYNLEKNLASSRRKVEFF
jgi:hypothetical protein